MNLPVYVCGLWNRMLSGFETDLTDNTATMAITALTASTLMAITIKYQRAEVEF